MHETDPSYFAVVHYFADLLQNNTINIALCNIMRRGT